MNRVIKFRGKAIEPSLGWIYGDLIQLSEVLPVIQRYEGQMLVGGEEYKRFSQDKVHPETVGQFTGLTDVNGREIYEGDIVCLYHEGHCTYKGIVRYQCGQFLAYKNDGLHTPLGLKPWIIVGNIHENPEMLEGGEE